MKMQKCLIAIIAMTLTALAASSALAADVLSLAGDWRFRLDEQKAGVSERWFAGALGGQQLIRLPGTIDDAGLGPKNAKLPTLEGPYRLYDYAGPAWYQRDIDIPPTWQGQRVTLFLERARWVTSVWLDDKPIGSQDSLISPHVYDFGVVGGGAALAPGKHRLTVCIDNTVKIDLGRFVSALFGGTWGNMNGVIGRIELAATPPVWIADVQVYPDVDKKLARVTVRIGNATGTAGHGALVVGGKSVDVAWSASGGRAEADVDMSRAKLWDEFSPNLSEVTVKLGADVRTVRFGMRKFAAKGTQFTLNDRPVFLRGTLECSIFPLTGYPPTDAPAWQRILRIMKSYGLNDIRFHSWCPPEAAFTAADSEGIIIQVEGPQANVQAGQDPQRDEFIEAEFKRIVDTYGNHPSFCTMTIGNEYGGKAELLTHWIDMLIARDGRHLYSSASAAQTTANRQWTESASGRGIHGASTDHDLRETVAKDGRPIIGHEVGQWMYFPDFNEIKKWTGVMAVKNFEMIRDDLEKKHLLDLAPKYVEASGRFATLLYKEEIEVLRRTQGYGGFSLLDLHDYPTQGTALVGLLDAFWDSKGFITPEAFRRFCGPTTPLLRMPKRTYTSDESFDATAQLAHFGPAALTNAQPTWSIKDQQGHEVAAGKLPPTSAATGGLTSLGAIHASLAVAPAPCKLNVTVALEGTEFINDWDIWVYPASATPTCPPNVTTCDSWDTAQAALGAGKKVIYFAASSRTKQSMKGSFLPVFWSPVWFPSQKPNTMGLLCDPQHPLLAHFPTESYTNWQWYELMQHSRLFVLDDAPATYRPTVQVIDNFARNHKLGVMFEAKVGSGQLLVCGFDLPGLDKDPAARQLLSSLYSYVGSAEFKPTQEFGADLLESLFVPKFSNRLDELGARIRADSQAPNYSAEQAIDGDPNTMWHTPWHGQAPKFPHELVVEWAKPAKLTGVTCLPRQDNNRAGWIKDYAVYASADGKHWGEPLVCGTFQRSAELQAAMFPKTVETRFLKFVAISSFEALKPYASLAELDVICEGQAPPAAAAQAALVVEEPVILTPPAPPTPRINGPTVYAVRPGSPFLYRIPCTGKRPMTFAAEGLPQGLVLNPDTGIITGAAAKAGQSRVTLVARNALGETRRQLRIVVGDQLALTPPMGWNSWYIHYNRVTDKVMRQAADQMIDTGMADYGYQYVNIDDCWMNAAALGRHQSDPKRIGPLRSEAGDILPNCYFPDMKAMADYIHGKGLKAGLYTSPGPLTCAGFSGSYQHEAQDARQFAAWGFDFLKYDWCSYGRVAKGKTLEDFKKPYQLMWGELQKLNRDVVFNLCQYGMGDVWNWGGEVGNSWRTTDDLGLEGGKTLPGFYSIGFSNAKHWQVARPGAWNDPDYILIGWVGDAHGLGQGKPTTLTPSEQYSYMSMWSLMAAPLVFSGDMAKLDAFTLNVLCNHEVIEVDQDALGKQGRVIRQSATEFVLLKELEDGSKAVGLFNLGEKPAAVSVNWSELGLKGRQRVRDVWRQKDLGEFEGRFEAVVPRHGVAFVRIFDAAK